MRLSRLILLPTALALAVILPASPVLAGTVSAKMLGFGGYAVVGASSSSYIGAKATFTVPKLLSGCSNAATVIGAVVGRHPGAAALGDTASSMSPSILVGVTIGSSGTKAIAAFGPGGWISSSLPITIRPGDRVQVRVTVARSTAKANFYFANYTTGATYSISKSIVLSKHYYGREAQIGLLGGFSSNILPNFGTLGISGANLQSGVDGAWKTVGVQPTIGRASMVNTAGTILAATGALNTTTLNSFSMVYKACK